MWRRIADSWCRQMHSRTMWPMHGRYICQECGREFALNWEPPAEACQERLYENRDLRLPSTVPIMQ